MSAQNSSLGELLGFLVGKAVKGGISGKIKANELNRYADTVNSSLPSDYQVPYQKRGFFFGDLAGTQRAIDDSAKRQLDQDSSDYYATRANLPVGPLSAVKDVYNSEYAPVQVERGKYGVQGEIGRQEAKGLPQILDYLDSASGGGPSIDAPPPMAAPPSFGKGQPQLEADPALAQQFTTGAQQSSYQNMPDLPDFVTPETLRSIMSYHNTQRGQNLTRQTATEHIAETRRMNDVRIDNMMQRLGLERQRVALYAKSIAQRSGRAPTKVEIAQSMLRAGEINKQQFQDFILARDINVLDFLGGGIPQEPASTPSGDDDGGGQDYGYGTVSW